MYYVILVFSHIHIKMCLSGAPPGVEAFLNGCFDAPTFSGTAQAAVPL